MPTEFYSPDAPFVKILGLPHLFYLLFCFVFVALFISKHKWIKTHINLMRKLFLILLSFQQIFLLYGWYATCTPNFISEGLPLQLCRVASLLTIVFLINKNFIYLDILSYFSVFALISLFYPLNVYNFSHISGISYMINHLITILIPIFAVIAFDWYPTWKSCKHAILGFTVYFPLALIANVFTGGNYFYQTSRPFLHSWSSFAYGTATYITTVVGFIIVTYLVLKVKETVLNMLFTTNPKNISIKSKTTSN